MGQEKLHTLLMFSRLSQAEPGALLENVALIPAPPFGT